MAELSYIKIFFDQMAGLETLTNEEVGSLLRGLWRYAQFKENPSLTGNERFLWPMLKNAQDKAEVAYSEYIQKASESGKKGGRPKKGYGFSEKGTLSKKGYGFSENQIKLREEEEEEEEKRREDEETRKQIDVGDDLLRISDAMNAVFDAAEGIGLKGAAAVERANRLAADYSAEWLLEAINRAANAPKDAWSWRYIEGILRSWKQNGGIDSVRKEQKPKTRREKYNCLVNGELVEYEREVPI